MGMVVGSRIGWHRGTGVRAVQRLAGVLHGVEVVVGEAEGRGNDAWNWESSCICMTLERAPLARAWGLGRLLHNSKSGCG